MMVHVDSKTVEARFIWRAVIVLATKAAIDTGITQPVIFGEDMAFTVEEEDGPYGYKLVGLCQIQGDEDQVNNIIFCRNGDYIDQVTHRMMRKWRQLKRIETDGAYVASFVEET